MLKNNNNRAIQNHTSENSVALFSEKRFNYASYSYFNYFKKSFFIHLMFN
jgi:hypothetical protein